MSRGNPKKIPTPEKMWELFLEYKDWCKSNPYRVHDFVGKDGRDVHREKERPLTNNGFDSYLADNQYIGHNIDQYRRNEHGMYNDFVDVMSRIHNVIREDQLCGAMCGVYQHHVTARVLGLVDKTENTHEVKEIRIIKS
jgi:hypothetical protein